ncbi:UDP-3-O-acyl-N-acetylglucosamine deacetylase [Kaistia dalseonensis]|uniref:UDP-3-O-acyl-N-acetylglucosamine deacetylase n=1 Tax=Kaistia dalseonensis TaxID=410840 RepID=A0ABU0HBS6_9HYPH|nr:UDP-3-O-acyl-N-acetylglucosamine deacetylase [Kaistia dalseonensis]MCX5497131.1 UDP-3-O-acyl-N-acetylglucosamine deacetylase [Kaistia dalseonensis]MDQ0439758.1 UDP-3-O-[3-hydroxymyristoyl] N-acetylglucosamine deacetylase [Kaistia dalseonensis]
MARQQSTLQTTLRDRVVVSGIGVHSGSAVSMILNPAEADTGIVFQRTDTSGSVSVAISATIQHLHATDSCTTIASMGLSVATIEHLLATFNGLGIDNVVVEIDGAEVPMMDGSAEAFVALVDQTGIMTLPAKRRAIKVLKPIRVEQGSAFAELLPHDGRRFEIEIDFESPLIGRQAFVVDLTPSAFRRDLARARTFGFMRDVEFYWSRGLALGSSLDNTVVLGEDRVLNPEGLRFADEFVRHKALDAVGDLALAGAPVIGCYRSYRGGHRLNAKIVETLLADPEAWTFVDNAASVRRGPIRAEMPVRLEAAAFGPDKS